MISKVIKILLILAIVLTIFNNYSVQAFQIPKDPFEPSYYDPSETDRDQALKDPIKNPSYYDPSGAAIEENRLMEMGGKILGIINTIGMVLSVIILMIIGIKYMLGSIEEKAEYKKTMMGYLIGAALLFAATTVPNILYQIGTSI